MKTFFTTIVAILIASTYAQAQVGSPDKSFGANGKILDTSIWADCRAMAVQPDGKILTGGHSDPFFRNSKDGGFYIARFNKDGSIDAEFGNKGKFIARSIDGAEPALAQAIAIQPDGKVIACGRFITHSPYGNIGLVRLYPDGKIDSSFGTNGFVTTVLSKWNDLIGDMVQQPDGKILVSGNKQVAPFTPGPSFLLRYMPDGSMDKSFGENGVAFTYHNDADVTPEVITLQPDGKILTGGIYGNSIRQFQVARYNIDGSLDKNFGEDGFARLTPRIGSFSELNDLAIQEDGKIIAAGNYGTGAMALARFDNAGKPDMSFGDQGAYTYFYNLPAQADAKNVFITKEKKIILTGRYYYDAPHQVAAFRYNEDGILDSSFGENGVAAGGFRDSKYGTDFTSGVGALQQDGSIIVSGSFLQNDGDTYNVALFGFNGDEQGKQPLMVRIKRWMLHHGISWQVQQNKDVRYYAVQRSADGIIYKEVARISGTQAANTYEDKAPLNNSYYRLMAVAKDGSKTYSNTVLIDESANVKVFPNPVRDNLQLQGLAAGKTSVSIVDLQGNVRSSSVAGGATYSVNTSQLTPGNYLLKLQHNSTTTTQPFVKE